MANRYNRKTMNNMGGNQRRFNNYDRDNFERPRYNVNPWQGGIVPNSGAIGPTGTTEATIALANNLINNILQSRQNPMPSLLDLNVRRDFGPNYMREDRYGPNKIGRNMQMGGQMNRRVVSGGRNDRMMNKVRRPMRPNTNNKPKTVQKNNQDKKDTSESKAENVTESENAEGEIKEEKREWKQEKTELDESTASKEGEEKNEKSDGQSPRKNDGIKTEFDGIASEFLECHICEKKMWDGRSFDNHIKGRVHNIMMDKTKQSYHMTADAMRQELKINEMKRTKRGFVPGAKRVFCAMCDLFVFHAAAHRRSPGHQKLKKYLHPSCNTCRKEFPTRIELDEHRLTAPHLRLLQEKQKDVQARPKPEVVMISTLQEELSQVRPIHEIKAKKGIKKEDGNETGEGNAEKVEGTDEIKTEDGQKDESEQAPAEDAVLLLDYKEGDDLTNMTRDNLPRYQTDRAVGPSYVTDFSCKHCTLCKKYFDTEETAEVHLRTWKHFQSYIRLIHYKGNFKANQEGVGKRDLASDGNAEEDGTWKRRKTDNDAENAENEDELINGNDGDSANEESMLDESQANGTNADITITGDDVPEDSMVQETEEVLDQTVMESDNTEIEQIEKPRPAARGRGRGRGNRGRRGARN